MRAIMETSFYVVYLTTVITLGIRMLRTAERSKELKLFGLMSIILGFGDAFHLIPRSYALFTSGMEANAAALGAGKLITSITMTIFYVLLYMFWRMHYNIKGKKVLSYLIYILASLRILLCLFPQNEWLNFYQPLIWGIYRNIPFAIIGLIILVIFYMEARKSNDKQFKFMWLAIALSFGFYIPVVLWAKAYTWVGMLMIPKTLAYVWIVLMGYKGLKKINK